MKTLTFRTGIEVPRLGFGTFQLQDEACTSGVREAIKLGYRHIDTAFAYNNHREVAAGIKQSGVDRKDLFVTTKIPLGQQRRDQVIQFGRKLQEELEIEYVDLLLIHWPNKEIAFSETLEAMGELVSQGVVRSIGVSNFNRHIMAEADKAGAVPLVTNQVEFHPFLYQRELLQACREKQILLTAYSPIARGEVLTDARMLAIAKRNGATPAQIALAWALEKGIIVIPKATGRDHIEENLLADQVTLSSDEIAEIDAFEGQKRLIDGPWKHYPLD
ncbi:MAG: aldo/keto reductase [Spirochaetia bacterium]